MQYHEQAITCVPETMNEMLKTMMNTYEISENDRKNQHHMFQDLNEKYQPAQVVAKTAVRTMSGITGFMKKLSTVGSSSSANVGGDNVNANNADGAA